MGATGSAAGDGHDGVPEEPDQGHGDATVDELVPTVGLHDDEGGIAVGTKLLSRHSFLLGNVTNNLATPYYTPFSTRSQPWRAETCLFEPNMGK